MEYGGCEITTDMAISRASRLLSAYHFVSTGVFPMKAFVPAVGPPPGTISDMLRRLADLRGFYPSKALLPLKDSFRIPIRSQRRACNSLGDTQPEVQWGWNCVFHIF